MVDTGFPVEVGTFRGRQPHILQISQLILPNVLGPKRSRTKG